MSAQDFWLVINWWSVLFFIGLAAYPLTKRLFSPWWDKGYLFSKAVGLGGVTLITWYLGSFKILPFTFPTILISLGIIFALGVGFTKLFPQTSVEKNSMNRQQRFDAIGKFLLLELLFFGCLWFWSYIKAFEPDIHGLEKFMDYGFARTIFNSAYFPPPDMWYAGGTINYYYFGHTMMALLSKLSLIDLSYGYNLMLATIFAYCFSMSFSIAVQLFLTVIKEKKLVTTSYRHVRFWAIVTGLLAAFLVSLAGNMQTIYAFTKGYNGDNTPPPFWQDLWPAQEFWQKLPDGINTYWYANATRFIPFTIHEFPGYSFVVSDNHGHVLGIPFALLAIASLFLLFGMGETHEEKTEIRSKKSDLRKYCKRLLPYGLYGVLGGILFMTNALDGPIYMGLFGIFVLFKHSRYEFLTWEWMKEKGLAVVIAAVGFLVTTMPFLLNFTSFANALAVNCPPAFMANTKIGPILFEGVEKCQKSPLWMMWLLWGFFWFNGIIAVILYWKRSKVSLNHRSPVYRFLTIIFIYSLFLIFFAEFFYFKDIYPQHFRSNTMFKLGYQAYMMCSILSGFVIVQMIHIKKIFQVNVKLRVFQILFFILVVPQLFLVSIFPLFSVRSYFNSLSQYKGLYGLTWFQQQYPDDYKAMWWLATEGVTHKQPSSGLGMSFLASLSHTDAHVKDNFFTSQLVTTPVILEADGDSYTDYDRMSAFSGMPTIVGWGVHEWLWRGTYDVVSPRKDEVSQIYEGDDQSKKLELLNKYNVRFIVIGTLERQKFTALKENDIAALGKEVFRSGDTVIYER